MNFVGIEETQKLTISMSEPYFDGNKELYTTTSEGINIYHGVVSDEHYYIWSVPVENHDNISEIGFKLYTAEHSKEEVGKVANNITVDVNENFGNG